MTKTTASLLATTIAIGSLGLGCGDDAPSKEEFAADLDAICRDTRVQIQKLKAPQTLEQLPEYTRKSRVLVDRSIDRAERLELPDEGKQEFKDYISRSRRSLTDYRRLERAAEKNDDKAVRRIIAETTEDNNRRDAQAKALGLKECGNTTAQG